jgi:serine/threonine protein kinase/formylglycine-generating enzyme required for sulfatase activity
MERAPDLPELIAGRYEREGLLGRGGMGSVWRVHDRWLGRTVAMKVVLSHRASPLELARFAEEARVAAGLQHPGILPVHELGALQDGRMWFTMQEVRGESLEQHLQETHRAWRRGDEGARPALRRLLESFLRVCEAVAYAHERGVIHRDLKPSNVMLGSFGEVFVLDWGLARLTQPPEEGSAGPRLTRAGAVTGTPAYMSPEQASGRSDEVTARSDVYSLGATLYDLLCDRPPRSGRDVEHLLAAIAAGTPVPPPSSLAELAPADEELDRICTIALAHAPSDRYPSAGGLARDLALWLDGARQRERALALVAEADVLIATSRASAAQASTRSASARERLASLPAFAKPEDKHEIWAIEDESRRDAHAAREAQTRAIQTLRSALSHAPELPEAHVRLADLYHTSHLELEAAGRQAEAATAASDLRLHDRLGRYVTYLAGTGRVTLVTSVEGALVRLHRLVEQQRRLVPVFDSVLGRTPLREVRLEQGGWVLTLHLEGHHDVIYPVHLRRCEHWDGSSPVLLPPLGSLEADDCYVPASFSWAGDDAFENRRALQRVWVDGFVVRRFPVTLGEYLLYLDALMSEGRDQEALQAQPMLGDADEPLLARDSSGRFVGIRTDMSGSGWDHLPTGPDTPITCVSWDQARGYARWRASREDKPWRLPMEAEWQKAARGADQRRYPWGDHFEPAWCRMAMTTAPNMIVPIGQYPTDESPYGVRGLAGNVADWALDGIPELGMRGDRVEIEERDAPQRLILGGTCGSGPKTCETGQRARLSPSSRGLRVGFRLFRSLG